MYLTFVRHGEPARGVPHDPGLTDLGRRQAAEAAAFLSEEDYAAVYVSPLRRATETAAPIAEALGLEPVVMDGLAEFDRAAPYRHFEDLVAAGDPRIEAYLRGDLSAWGTTAEAFRSAVAGAVDRIVAGHPGRRVVVVSHGGVANVFFAAVLGIDRLAFHSPAYGSVSRARAGAGRYSLVSLNECGHLSGRAALSTATTNSQ
ncbi:histidine phosphatase family protein [Actinophytocola sp.]|jgi:probable phosphoglycerate mutase|uniref:histidine phosphatase family protein n=1 Tax=Actinophytocola sp. TaxID=1872138 RepID=UPI002ED83BDF